MYRLRLAKRAVKDLDRLHGDTWQRVRDSLNALGGTPRPQGCVKLEGAASIYRIRVGDYRVLYEVDDAATTILVLRVQHRRDAYRDL